MLRSILLQPYRGRQSMILVAIVLGSCYCIMFLMSSHRDEPLLSLESARKTTAMNAQAVTTGLNLASLRCTRNDCESGSDSLVLYTTVVEPSKRRAINYPDQHVYSELVDNRTSSVYSQVARFVFRRPPRTKPNSIFFHLATPAHRLHDPDCPLRHWAHNSNVHVLLTLPINDKPDAESVARGFFVDLGLATFHIQKATTDFYGDVWSSGLPKMVEIASSNHFEITHYVLMDDDTMITSLESFRHILDEHDPDVAQVIGAPSEQVEMIVQKNAGQGGFGGAGIILTRALAMQVSDAWTETGVFRYTHTAGDMMLTGAISFVQNRPMRSPNIYYERALHQIDVRDFASSIFKSGWRWITVHHWKWFDIFPETSKTVQLQFAMELFDTLGAENVFANHLLAQNENETVILTNGYCITSYTPPLTELELYRLEAAPGALHWHHLQSWEATHGPFRPLRDEGATKRTQWITSLEPKTEGADVYYMTFESLAQDTNNQSTTLAWVVS